MKPPLSGLRISVRGSVLAPASSSRCGAVVAIYLRATDRTTRLVVDVVVVVNKVRMTEVKPIRAPCVKYGLQQRHQRVVQQRLAPAVERGGP
jgi:hypothetical protein